MCVASILTLLWCGLGSLPLSAHGLWNCQAHFMEIRQPIVLSSSVAPSPHGSITFEQMDPWGDGSRFRRWRFKIQGMTVLIQTRELYPPLTRCQETIYDAWHMSSFHWILSRIEASLRLLCTSSINITLLLSHFSIFCWKHTVRAHPLYLSETTPFNCSIRHQRPSSVH